MTTETDLQTTMKKFWQTMVDANDALNNFINAGLPLTVDKRHRTFTRRWDAMKEQAETLCESIEQLTENDIAPVEVTLPWKSEAFARAWQNWKEYLAEQHHRYMKSRMEYAALAHLKKLSDGKETVAVEYLQFAMAGGYPRFFKYEQPTTAGGRGDGDF